MNGYTRGDCLKQYSREKYNYWVKIAQERLKAKTSKEKEKHLMVVSIGIVKIMLNLLLMTIKISNFLKNSLLMRTIHNYTQQKENLTIIKPQLCLGQHIKTSKMAI